MKTTIVRLALLLSAVCSGPGCATPAPSTLSVEGSSFVMHLADGRELRSPDMIGASVFLAYEGRTAAEMRIVSVSPDPESPDILRHQFEVRMPSGEWIPACKPGADGQTWGFPVVLPEGHPGRQGTITMACSAGGAAARGLSGPLRSPLRCRRSNEDGCERGPAPSLGIDLPMDEMDPLRVVHPRA